MNPPMTPLDQTLVDQIKTALSKSAPDLTQFLGWTEGDGTSTEGYKVEDFFSTMGQYLGPDEHGIEPIFPLPMKDGDYWYLGNRIEAELKEGSIYINDSTYPDAWVRITPQVLQALQRFAEQIGWQCD